MDHARTYIALLGPLPTHKLPNKNLTTYLSLSLFLCTIASFRVFVF